MSIQITRTSENAYLANVTPPHGRGREWAIDTPVSARELVALLIDRGCHQTDIGDAFFDADPEWLMHLDG